MRRRGLSRQQLQFRGGAGPRRVGQGLSNELQMRLPYQRLFRMALEQALQRSKS